MGKRVIMWSIQLMLGSVYVELGCDNINHIWVTSRTRTGTVCVLVTLEINLSHVAFLPRALSLNT